MGKVLDKMKKWASATGETHPEQMDTLDDDEALEDFGYYLAVKDNPRRVVNVTDEVKELMERDKLRITGRN